MISQRLEQKLLQKLSPQQILLMKLLQVPAISLEQRIKQEIEENPALEDITDSDDLSENEISDTEDEFSEKDISKEDEFDINDYYDSDDYEIASYKLQTNNNVSNEDYREIPFASNFSYHETLMDQIGMLTKDEREYNIAAQIVGTLEDSGYLLREIDAIVDDLAFTQNLIVSDHEVEKVLINIVQYLEPPGIGARNLQECLLIQLKRIEISNKNILKLAIEIIENNFNEFTKKHYEKIISHTGCSENELKDALAQILKLNPKPGGLSSENRINNYIIPDFYITQNGNKLELTLHSQNSPELRLSKIYKNMYAELSESGEKSNSKQKEALQFVRQKLDSANWFIDAIEQRKNTLQITMEAIMNYQYEYFLTGNDAKLKPMILKDIAEIVNMDISTISRVANSKYVQTQHGTFLLKNFFSESMTTDAGEEVSSREVKKILTDCVDNEDKRKPLTDDQLMKILNDKGYNIARRTVAKYREQLNIPVGRLRKEL